MICRYRILCAMAAIGLLGAGCDDPPLQPADATMWDLGDNDTGPGFAGGDVFSADQAAANDGAQGAEGGPLADVGQLDADAASDAKASADSGPMVFDIVKKDVPAVPLEVISTDPADGAVGVANAVVFTVHFSAPLLDASIADYTVTVKGPGDQPIAGDLKVVGDKFTFTAITPLPPASRVWIELSTLVQSDKGNTLAEPFAFVFYTVGYPGTAAYQKLAARYAPTLWQGLADAKYDRLRSPDYDQDWNGANNVANLAKFDAIARVGWAVVETRSHFFIHYAFYWPRRVATTGDLSFDNDMAGSTVVVARYPNEQPVALLTWFKNQYDEQMWGWVSSESGLVAAGTKPSAANMRQVLPAAQLFPVQDVSDQFGCEGLTGCVPRRYHGYLSAGSHQSCLWLEVGDKGYNQCRTDAQAKSTMKLIAYRPGAVATKAEGAGVAPDQTITPFVYELVPIFDHWFPHREEAFAGGIFAPPLSFTYKPPPQRPAGAGTPLATRFASAAKGDFGRPPWAWQWKPGTFTSYYQMPMGTPFLDPAWALFQRLGGSGAGLAKFDAATKKGMSLDYCFQPFLFIDQRDSPPCKDSLASP